MAFTGSLPPGGSPDLYARLIRLASTANVQVAVDAAGEVLRLAALAGPDLVKVNLDEFESAFPGQSHDWGRLQAQYQALAAGGLKRLILTDGARGALIIDAGDQFWVRTDVPTWVAAVGAGDTFLAGLLFALGRGHDLREAACLASAAAAANLQVLGCGFIEPADVSHYLERTHILEAPEFVEVAV
jgi:fructose-1-phosphate kinase PfkB-like protein